MNLITTLNHITDIAESLQLVNSAYKGSPYDHWNSSEIKYGSVCVAVENVSRDNLMTYNLVLYYADRLTQDRSNLYEVQTDATNILTSILNSLEEIGEVETPYNIELFDQQFSDYLAGGFVRFGLVIESPLGDCEMEDYEEDPTPYYIDKNGTYHLNGNYLLDVDVPQSGKLQTKTVEFQLGDTLTVSPDSEYSGLKSVEVKQAQVDMTSIGFPYATVPQWAKDGDWSKRTNINYCFRASNLGDMTISLPKVTSASYGFSMVMANSLTITDISSLADLDYTFYGANIKELNLPKSLPNLFSLKNCFYNTTIKSFELTDVPSLNSLYYTFYGSSVETVKIKTTANLGDLTYAFRGCSKLKTLELGDTSGVKKTLLGGNGGLNYWLYGCTALENFYADKLPGEDGNSLSGNYGFSACTKLTHQSLLNILNALPTVTVANTCSLGATNLAKLTAEEKAIATNKGWTLN